MREQASGTPLVGVLMTLSRDDSAGPAVMTALTNHRGAYFLRAPQPGRYRLGAKRIGVRPFESEAIELAASQDIERDVELEALAYRLPTVTVRSDPLCVRRPDRADRIASLWDEIRTVLTATQVSLRDRLVRARVVRYVHELDAQSLRVQARRLIARSTTTWFARSREGAEGKSFTIRRSPSRGVGAPKLIEASAVAPVMSSSSRMTLVLRVKLCGSA